MIIFDSIIGNGDRHQENWGIIADYKEGISYIQKESKNKSHTFGQRLILKLVAVILKQESPTLEKPNIIFHSLIPSKFAPIYDSGSCLGRELVENKVEQMLKDQQLIHSYVFGKKATSEIHWKGRKLNHFELIEKISDQHKDVVLDEIKRFVTIFDDEKIKELVLNIDSKLPNEFISEKLPLNRKELIIKMVILRVNKLQEYIT